MLDTPHNTVRAHRFYEKADSGKYQKMNCRCGSAIPMRTAISFCWNYSVLEERIDMMQTETRYIRPAAERGRCNLMRIDFNEKSLSPFPA